MCEANGEDGRGFKYLCGFVWIAGDQVRRGVDVFLLSAHLDNDLLELFCDHHLR